MDKTKTLEFMRKHGPLIPVELSKFLESNILLASAHLSELRANDGVQITRLKVGGSPLYYLKGQEEQLMKFSDHLHDKEKKAYTLLMEKKVLRDSVQEPVIRVALREIKDFAVPLEVNFQGQKEVFWKWYLVGNAEAESLIKPFFEENKPEEKQEQPIEEPTPAQEEVKPAAPSEGSLEQPAVSTDQKPPKNISEKTNSEKNETVVAKQPTEKKESSVEKKIVEKTKPITEETKDETKSKKPKKEIDPGAFMDDLLSYFKKNKIELLSKEVIRKTEVDFIVSVPSAVGTLEYYCKAKNKKKINDTDLASAFVQGQLKKMPVLFLTGGEMTKRAKEMLETDFKGMTVGQL